jgi:hypothetical protein
MAMIYTKGARLSARLYFTTNSTEATLFEIQILVIVGADFVFIPVVLTAFAGSTILSSFFLSNPLRTVLTADA